MQLTYNGMGSFELVLKRLQGETHCVIDPFVGTGKVRFPRTLEANLVTCSSSAETASNTDAVGGDPFVINVPGEYEVGGVFVYGVPAAKKDESSHTIFRIEVGDISLGHLGSLDRKLTDEEVERLGNIDVLLLPIGGGDVLDTKEAVELVQMIEPRMVVPMWYGEGVPGVKHADTGMFVKAMGAPSEETSKLKLKRSQLPEEDMRIVVLTK